jgi:cell division protein FtsQ
MWDEPKQLNAIAACLIVLTFAAVCWTALSWLVRQPAFAFREVLVKSPLERVNPAHVEAVIRDELYGTFFTMDLDRSRAALTRVPWVRNVALRRQWPRRLEITVEEHVPLARWNDAGLVNTQGEVFTADYNDELPQFSGPGNRAVEVAGRYREWASQLARLGLTLNEVSLSPRGGWHLRTAGRAGPLAVELGRDDPAARLSSFIAVYGRTVGTLTRAGTPIEHVDLRYRNGFAAQVPGFKERAPKKSG